MIRLRSITVRELRELLEDQDDDMMVIFTSDYGDYHHTKQALPLSGEAVEMHVVETGYSQSGWQLYDQDHDETDEDLEEELGPLYLVLS